MHVYHKAAAEYLTLREQGAKVVSKNLLKIMSTLLPLRRICSGGSLSYADLRVVSNPAKYHNVRLTYGHANERHRIDESENIRCLNITE